MHEARNVGPIERRISLSTAGLLALLAAKRRGVLGALAGALSAGLFFRGISGYCPIYGALGIQAARPPERRNPPAVTYGTGVRVEESIWVSRPAAELYAFWRRLDTLPQFMDHVQEVTVLTEKRSRWRVRAPIGSRVTWEAEIVSDVPAQLIGWRSLPGSAVHHAGSVHFDQRDGLTEVRVVLDYAPPVRRAASLPRLLGDEPREQIAQDLRRFKAIVERGERANRQ